MFRAACSVGCHADGGGIWASVGAHRCAPVLRQSRPLLRWGDSRKLVSEAMAKGNNSSLGAVGDAQLGEDRTNIVANRPLGQE
jgi:hypothetical protein